MQAKKFLPVWLLFCALFYAPVFGQNIVQEAERSMALGSRPCFRIDFAKTDEDFVEKLWKNFVKDQFDAKLKKDKKAAEWSALGVESSAISNDKFDIYSRVEGYGGDGATLLVWFDVGSYFLNRRDASERTNSAVDVLKQFYYNVRREIITKELEKEEDKQKDLEKKLRNLQKDKTDLEKDIENFKAKIKKAEDDIVQNGKDQEKANVEIEQQRRAVDMVRQRLSNVEKEN